MRRATTMTKVADNCVANAKNLIESIEELSAIKLQINALRKDMRRKERTVNRILDTSLAKEKHSAKLPVVGDRIRVKEIFNIYDHTYTRQWMADEVGTVLRVNKATITVCFDACGANTYNRIDADDCYVLV